MCVPVRKVVMCPASLKQWALFLPLIEYSAILCKYLSDNDRYQIYNSEEYENILYPYVGIIKYLLPTVTDEVTGVLNYLED